ncbi:hypothetical protein LB505_006863 [Fusarium chuoi]|nr:hypothetical protein LB505_006863 [Fusarium chuoi]
MKIHRYIRRKGEVRVISLQRTEIAGFPPLFKKPSVHLIQQHQPQSQHLRDPPIDITLPSLLLFLYHVQNTSLSSFQSHHFTSPHIFNIFNTMSSQTPSSSSSDPSNERPSELEKLHFVATFEHKKLLEDISNSAYDLGLKAGRGQASLHPDDETQALILSLTDRNDELEKQIKDQATDSLLDLAKEVRKYNGPTTYRKDLITGSGNNVTAAHRAVSATTHAECLKPNDYRTLRESCSQLAKLEDKCEERVGEISRGVMKRPGSALERKGGNKRPFRG